MEPIESAINPIQQTAEPPLPTDNGSAHQNANYAIHTGVEFANTLINDGVLSLQVMDAVSNEVGLWETVAANATDFGLIEFANQNARRWLEIEAAQARGDSNAATILLRQWRDYSADQVNANPRVGFDDWFFTTT